MPAYYNENDPTAAAWLRELIKAGQIADGFVDERSIKEVKPNDIEGYTQAHFFAGIGGWSLALRLAGVPDDFPVWTGSCPCQPFSAAGKRKGQKDSRHLWPWFRHLIFRCRPSVTFGEQVASADGRVWLGGVRANLEALGYVVGAADLCSAGVGSPNIRQRLWWMANSGRHASRDNDSRKGFGACAEPPKRRGETICESAGRSGFGGLADSNGNGCHQAGECEPASGNDGAVRNGRACRMGNSERDGLRSGGRPAADIADQPGFWSLFDILPCRDGKTRRVEPGTFPLVDGLSGRVGLLRGYGNAINPWVAAEFIKACF